MNTREATQILKSLGWRSGRVGGDRCARFYLPDRIVGMFYDVIPSPGEQQLSLGFTLTTRPFSDAWATIEPYGDGHAPLTSAWEGLDIRAPEILAAHVRQGSDKAIAWAKAQDPDQALRDCAALPTTGYGTKPHDHLAALAILGDIDRLQFYQSRFEVGDRLGFVPSVTRDHIDRAVTLAAQCAARARPDNGAS